MLARPARAALEAALLLAFVLALGLLIRSHPAPSAADRWWADTVSGMRSTGLDFLAIRVFNPLGRVPWSWGVVAVAAFTLQRAGRRSAILVLVMGEVASWATNSLIKVIVDRPRPPGGLIDASGSSFPSGHAAFAAVTAVLLVVLLVPSERRTGWAVLGAALAVGMAWSRTYLMVHWLTDVVGGSAVGAAVGLGTLSAWSRGQAKESRTRSAGPR